MIPIFVRLVVSLIVVCVTVYWIGFGMGYERGREDGWASLTPTVETAISTFPPLPEPTAT